MKIKRTYKDTSLKHGQVEIINKNKMREIYHQTDIYVGGLLFSQSGAPPVDMRTSDFTFAELVKVLERHIVAETFFSRFEFVSS